MRWGHGIDAVVAIRSRKRKRTAKASAFNLNLERAARRFYDTDDCADGVLDQTIDRGGSAFAGPIDARVVDQPAKDLAFIGGQVREVSFRLFFAEVFQRRGYARGNLELF